MPMISKNEEKLNSPRKRDPKSDASHGSGVCLLFFFSFVLCTARLFSTVQCCGV
jgi:hypothetical protein